MGIIILAVLALGIFTVLRMVFGFFKARISVKAAVEKNLIQPVSDEPSWAVFEVPAFIRRGMQYPVLSEKKKRTRKAKKNLGAVATA